MSITTGASASSRPVGTLLRSARRCTDDIFLLFQFTYKLTANPQHFRPPTRPCDQHPIPTKIAQENQTRLDQIQTLFTNIVPDLTSMNSWRYRSISGGIQEDIEAISFEHYLRTQTLISHEEACTRFPAGIMATEEDYSMGLFDLTGEMMRFAVLSLSSGNAAATSTTPAEIKSTDATKQFPIFASSQADLVVDLRAMCAGFEELTVPK